MCRIVRLVGMSYCALNAGNRVNLAWSGQAVVLGHCPLAGLRPASASFEAA